MHKLSWLVVLAALICGGGYYWFTNHQSDLVASLVVNKMLDNLDSNGDGVLTKAEGPPGMFSLLDASGDGIADRAELIRFIARSTRPFRWNNPLSPEQQTYPGLTHATFRSPSMNVDVGYNIYLPPGYHSDSGRAKRYPVIYYLHGGRPGNESLSVELARSVHKAVESGSVRPLIFVWVNGGRVSHYNYADSPGEDLFIKELIPHVDKVYRTLAHRGGRALQGFSQGGRGATRIMFKYPELFASAAPGGAGYAVEQQIQNNGGVELDQRQGADAKVLDFGIGNDAYSLAERFATLANRPDLPILVWGGVEGFNYAAIKDYLSFLDGLGIAYEQSFAPGLDHNPLLFYQQQGFELLRFHDRYWRKAVDTQATKPL